MKVAELERATAEYKDLKDYLMFQERFAHFEVVGVVLRQKGKTGDGSVLSCSSGMYGWHFSDAISKRFTEHFHGWFGDHVADRIKALRALGVEASDD